VVIYVTQSDDCQPAERGPRSCLRGIGRGGRDQSGLVREDDDLHPVPQPELHQQAGDVRFDGCLGEGARLLTDDERRVFRTVSVFPGPFTLAAAEAVAGPGAGPSVLALVDCSLLVPPRAGSDGRSRYTMLETLQAYGAGGPSRMLADALVGRASVLRELGPVAEAAEDARSALALAREIGYPGGEVTALAELSQAAAIADDLGRAVRLARQAEQVTADIPGRIDRFRSASLTSVLIAAGDLGAAGSACAAGLARSRAAGSLVNVAHLLILMVFLDVQAGRAEEAATHLREALQIVVRVGDWYELQNGLDSCGHLCAATGRAAEAVTAWSAQATLMRHEAGWTGPQMYGFASSRCARPGRCSGLSGPALPRTAARR